MADPLSVAGSAVGVVSLGLFLCKELVSYYRSWSSQNQDVQDIISRIEQLANILEILKGSLNRLSESGYAAALSQVESSVLSCSNAMTKLQETLEKCHRNPKPDSPVDMFIVQTKRLLFPFRKDTLENLKSTGREFRENLTLALSVLQLFVAMFICFQSGS